MNKQITIYSNLENNNFFRQIFTNYKIEINPISLLFNNEKKTNEGIIFYNTNNQKTNYDFKILKNNYLLVSNSQKKISGLSENITVIKPPISINQIINYINKFLLTKKIEFKEIIIINKKLINNYNNKSSLLTDIEFEILSSLIQKKECSKEFIKKNILKIKTDIKTNSIDSHLTRIRKKLESINTSLIIRSKNDIIKIYSS